MFLNKPQQVVFRDQIDSVLAADSEYQMLLARRAEVTAEISVRQGTATEISQRLTAAPAPADESGAIAAGIISPSRLINREEVRYELAETRRRVAVLSDAVGKIDMQLRDRKHDIAKEIYFEGIRGEQYAAAEKAVDTLLDMAATRLDESRRLAEVQACGVTISGMPRIGLRWATFAFIDEYIRQQLQPIGYKPTEDQLARLDGLKRGEAGG